MSETKPKATKGVPQLMDAVTAIEENPGRAPLVDDLAESNKMPPVVPPFGRPAPEAQAVPESPKELNVPPADATQAPTAWVRMNPGEAPAAGQYVKCQDGTGKVSWVKGPNLEVKLDNGYLWRGGIDQVLVQA